MLAKFLVLVLVFSSGVFALDVDWDCPDEIYAGEEFECDVEVDDGDDRYDLKIEVDEERNSALEIWNGEDWQSGYYYLKDFIRDDEVVKLRVDEEGRYDVVLKLRHGDFREEFDVGKLKVLEALDSEVEDEEGEEVRDEAVGNLNFVSGNDVIELG